jgi:quinol monooxygenase YgiN
MAPRALENDAQRVVVWCDDQQNQDRFHLFEIYSDPAAMGANASAPWFAEYMATAGPLLAGEPTVVMGTIGWSKGV